ncbi:plastocyanin/azurin family copper-binding protein [Paenibacillus sp. CF384]|uniref:plastocyanin/azurin family copper-binding protein n=1 Tax=Paenibacillus sp. CF384 TaxID=1884382 RepID=UPI00089CEC47|nr:plastocyanin/azurin family copper-binding protein [Paenibacillus sp. CF384]SDW94297.1 Plastocyanin [Paenibacillus sp. CF384]
MQRKTRSNRVGASWNKGYLLVALGLLICLSVSACSSNTNSAATENHVNHNEMAMNDAADSPGSGEDSSVNSSADDDPAAQPAPATDDTQVDDKGGNTSTNNGGTATATEPKPDDSNAAAKPDDVKADPKPAADDKGGTKGDSNDDAHHDDSKATTPAAKPSTKPATKPPAKPAAKPETKPDEGTTTKPDKPAAGADNSKAEVKSKTYVVEIKEFAFTVSSLTIRPGDTVKFINRDKVKHTATADDGSFDTGLLGLDEEKSVTFDTEGEFSYYCAPHPAMQATIIVAAK